MNATTTGREKTAFTKVLLIFFVMELGIRWWTRPYVGPFQEFVHENMLVSFLFISSLFIVVPIAYVRFTLGVPASYLGISARNWTREMKWVLTLGVILETAAFFLIRSGKLRAIFEDPVLPWLYFCWAFEELLFGFNQELMYRGVLQGELDKWLGSTKSLITSSVIFTLGPIHWDQLSVYPLTIAVFAMGMLSGWLFNRYRNVIIPGVFHGIANSFLLGVTYTLQGKT